ncbi:MAG: hypothetical protein HQL32_15505 [Planctomycetes bacterium]|nr:hypothetical protein [Planctomycetota bacterium]
MSAFSFPSPFDVGPQFAQYTKFSFEGKACFGDFCRYVWEHHQDDLFANLSKREQSEAMMSSYLESV